MSHVENKPRVLNIRMRQETKDKLDVMAGADGLTVTDLVTNLIEQAHTARTLQPRAKKEIIQYVSALMDQASAK